MKSMVQKQKKKGYSKSMTEVLESIPLDSVVEHLTDDIASGPLLEILFEDVWILAEEDVFGCWTGLRRKNGEEVHGPIYPLGGTTFYTGARVCGCKACQEHVEAKFKKN